MRILTSWLGSAVLAVACLLGWPPQQAAAAGASPFCMAGQTFEHGFCVNVVPTPPFTPANPAPCPPGWGPVGFGPKVACVGLSDAALESQSLDSTERTISQDLVTSTMESVSTRSDSESCPAGERRINGVCRTDSSALPLNYAPGSYYDYQPGRLFLKTPPSASTSYGSHMGAWVQTFGDYEQRTETTGTTTPSLGGVAGTLLTPNPAGGPNQILSLSSALGRTTGTGGVMGGFDVTMPFDSSVLLAGLLTGYTSTHVSFTNSVDTADMFGPTVGAYAAYVRGQFSVDGIVKADLLTLNQSFSDFSGTPFAVSGSSSIRLDNYSEAVNFNYRIPMGRWYLQPTAGTTYTQEVYGGDAAALGLADGTDWRLQAGARIGTNWMFGKLAVNSTLTGLVYDDAIITGGTINQGGFAGTIIPTDEGKLFGELLWASTADLGRGFSGVTAANVYFRTGVFGVGGQAGLRYQW